MTEKRKKYIWLYAKTPSILVSQGVGEYTQNADQISITMLGTKQIKTYKKDEFMTNNQIEQFDENNLIWYLDKF